jgi:phosphinothricin acetyltransferase
MKIEDIQIRTAVKDDLKSIDEIYNQAIQNKFSTAHTSPFTVEERMQWFAEHASTEYPIYAAMIEKKVVGWISVSPYRSGRMALRFTKEISYYVHNDFKNRGVASQLLQFVLSNATLQKTKTFIAIVLDRNEASINLLKKFQFEQWGYLPRVAEFEGVVCGHLYFGFEVK